MTVINRNNPPKEETEGVGLGDVTKGILVLKHCVVPPATSAMSCTVRFANTVG